MSEINNVNNYNAQINSINTNSVNDKLKRISTDNSFKEMLSEQIAKSDTELKFSKHAQERVEQRGIEITDKLMNELSNAVDKARVKGAKDIVIINEKSAFIVNVPNNTVVTTMVGSEMKDNIFTKIDSAVII